MPGKQPTGRHCISFNIMTTNIFAKNKATFIKQNLFAFVLVFSIAELPAVGGGTKWVERSRFI